jgi:hypothetical protein
MHESASSLPTGGTLDAERPAGDSSENMGPDPVIGAGIALFGIFLMGTGGAREAHYLFDVGVAIAVIGAIVFTLFVTLSALKQRLTQTESEAPPAA